MNIIIDLIVVAIVVITALISARKGFVRTVIEVVGFVAALLLAFSLSTPLANITYDKVIEPTIISAVEKTATDGTQNAVDGAWDALPEYVKSNSGKMGISKDLLSQKISENSASGVTTVAQTTSQNVARPIAVKILGMVYSTVLMIILLIVVKFLARIVGKLFSFSIVGKLNRVLGGIIGIPKGIVIALALCMIISLVVSFIPGGFWIFNDETLSKTEIFSRLSAFSPFQ